MIENLPIYIPLTFGFTTILTLGLFIWTIKSSNVVVGRKKVVAISIGLIVWLMVHAILTLQNIYKMEPNEFPTKMMLLGILPPLLLIFFLFTIPKGQKFIDSLPLKNLTFLNVIRVPVEVVLFWLFLDKAVPEIMTFEGRNFDIIAGISAPFLAYFMLKRGRYRKQIALLWNFVCLALLINIVVIGLLSTSSPLQKFAIEQPNIAILNFPFSWLPTFIVPIILFGHLASIKKLLKRKQNNDQMK